MASLLTTILSKIAFKSLPSLLSKLKYQSSPYRHPVTDNVPHPSVSIQLFPEPQRNSVSSLPPWSISLSIAFLAALLFPSHFLNTESFSGSLPKRLGEDDSATTLRTLYATHAATNQDRLRGRAMGLSERIDMKGWSTV
jgi:hypothetical protein